MTTFFFIIILLFLSFSSTTTTIATHNRRALHHPFFPLPPSTAPSQSPTAQPPSSPSFPKYPFSSNPNPFFPLFPSPPPPSTTTTTPSTTTTEPTFPANISSLIFPNSHSPPTKSSHSSKKLIPAIVISTVSFCLLVLALAFFFHRRRRHLTNKATGTESRHLFQASTVASDGRKLSASSAPASSEFLYMGTLVNSRSGGDGASSAHPAVGSPYRKLGSPELQPLPPLTRHSRHTYADAEGGHSSDEEFYSPRDSTAEKENNGGLLGGQGSSSRRIFQVPVMDKCGDRSSPCYSSSNPASSPAPSSPCRLSPPNSSSTGSSILKSLNSHFANVVSDGDAVLHPPSPPPSLRPMTPSPPKRKPPSPSPPSSPLEKDLDNNAAASDVRRQNQKSAARTGGFERNPFSEAPQMPPPPPPLPPSGYWEGKSPRMPPLVFNPPPLVSPRHSGTQMAAVFPADSPRNSEDTERNHKETPRPKLKPLHWDKVWASSDRAMVWDHLKSSSFQLNEEMIEALFVCNSTNLTPREMARRQILPSLNQENRVLDPKKSQNIAILLRALNVTKEEVCEALCEGNTDSLGTELLETLLKMAPSKEEERKLKEYKDDSPFKLGSAEKFLKAVLDIPFAFKRVEAMLYITNFDADVNYLRNSFETLEAACDELKSSRMFLKLLEAVLKTGNRMNVGTNRGDAHAFKLDTLLKLVDVKGTDGKTTLLHFVVQEIVRAESSRLAAANQNLSSGETRPSTLDDLEFKRLGLQVVVGLSGELGNVKKAAAMDSGVLNTNVLKLAGGIGKISTVLRLNGSLESEESGRRFHDAISKFLITAEDEIARIQAKEHTALSLVKELTEYFHGNSAKEEAHPLRIFMVVRDFLSILDQVCKEVGKVNGRAIVGTARQFSALVTPPLPAVFPRFHAPREGSSDDSESSSSSS